MVRSSIAIALALTARFGFARHCQNFTIPVTISAQNSVWNITPPSNNVEVIDLVLNLNRQGHSYAQDVFDGVCNSTPMLSIRLTDAHSHSTPLSVVPTISQRLIVHRITAMAIRSKFSPMEVDLTERKIPTEEPFEPYTDLPFKLLGFVIQQLQLFLCQRRRR